jgi:hypothetical protein
MKFNIGDKVTIMRFSRNKNAGKTGKVVAVRSDGTCTVQLDGEKTNVYVYDTEIVLT